MSIFLCLPFRSFEDAFNGIWLVCKCGISINATITVVSILLSINPRGSKVDECRGNSAHI